MAEPFVYQASDGRWIIFNNNTKSDYFNTESEAEEMAEKLTFAGGAQTQATTLAQIGEGLAAVVDVYFDRGYNSGGSNPITNDDISSLGITAIQLGDVVTLAQQLANFLGNAAVSTADYGSTLNQVRTDL